MKTKIHSEYTMGVLADLNCKAHYHNSKFENCKQLIDDDFAYQVAWQLEDAVINQHLTNLYLTTASMVEEEGAESGLHLALERWREYTSKVYNVRNNSTSEVSNMMSTWKYICKLEVCEYIEKLINSYQPKLNLKKS